MIIIIIRNTCNETGKLDNQGFLLLRKFFTTGRRRVTTIGEWFGESTGVIVSADFIEVPLGHFSTLLFHFTIFWLKYNNYNTF